MPTPIRSAQLDVCHRDYPTFRLTANRNDLATSRRGLPPVAVLAGSRDGRLVASNVSLARDSTSRKFNFKAVAEAEAISREFGGSVPMEENVQLGERKRRVNRYADCRNVTTSIPPPDVDLPLSRRVFRTRDVSPIVAPRSWKGDDRHGEKIVLTGAKPTVDRCIGSVYQGSATGHPSLYVSSAMRSTCESSRGGGRTSAGNRNESLRILAVSATEGESHGPKATRPGPTAPKELYRSAASVRMRDASYVDQGGIIRGLVHMGLF